MVSQTVLDSRARRFAVERGAVGRVSTNKFCQFCLLRQLLQAVSRPTNSILELLNERVLEMHYESWWEEINTKCYNTETADLIARAAGISIENIGGVFLVIASGTILACATLGLEIYWFRWLATERPEVIATTRKGKMLDRVFGGLQEAMVAQLQEEQQQSDEKRRIRDIYVSEFGMCNKTTN